MAMNVRSGFPLWVRVMRTVSLTALAVPMVLLAAVLTNVGGYRGGWAWASLLFGASFASAGWFGWTEGAGRPAVVMVLVVAGVIFGLLVAGASAYSGPRIKAEMDRIKAPEGFVKVDDQLSGGGCIDSCPAMIRSWLVAGTLESAQQRITAALAAGGFEMGPWEQSDDRAKGRHGKLRVTAITATTQHEGNPVVPENHVLVTVIMTS
jgi:hypothetical protein